MVRIIALVIIAVCSLLLLKAFWVWHINETRRKGALPLFRKPTLFDVRELLRKGEKDLAVRTYCQIFNVKPSEALKAIEELERSLKSS